jgi:hypothetical protein
MADKRIRETRLEVGITGPARALYERIGPTGISRHE